MRARQRVQRHSTGRVPCSREPRHGLSHASEPAEIIPALPWTRSAVLVIEASIRVCSAWFASLQGSRNAPNRDERARPRTEALPERLQGVPEARPRGPNGAAEHCLARVIAPLTPAAYSTSLQARLALVSAAGVAESSPRLLAGKRSRTAPGGRPPPSPIRLFLHDRAAGLTRERARTWTYGGAGRLF